MSKADWWQTMFDQKYLDTYLGGLTAERTTEEVDFYITASRLKPSDQILDLACGHGRHSIDLAKRGFAHVTGSDYSEVFIAKAINDAKNADVDARFIQEDMKDLSYAEEFDVVLLLFTAFGYFDDETNKDVLKLINKSLKPDGRFLIDVVSGEAVIRRFEREGVLDSNSGLPLIARQVEMSGITTDESEWFDKKEQVLHSHREWSVNGVKKEYDYYLHVYTMQQYEQMLKEAGFTVETTWGDTNGNPFSSVDDTSRTIILARKMPYSDYVTDVVAEKLLV